MRGSHSYHCWQSLIFFIVGHDCRNSGRWWCYGFVPTHYRVISPCLYYFKSHWVPYLPLSSSNFYELYKITSSTKSWCLHYAYRLRVPWGTPTGCVPYSRTKPSTARRCTATPFTRWRPFRPPPMLWPDIWVKTVYSVHVLIAIIWWLFSIMQPQVL